LEESLSSLNISSGFIDLKMFQESTDSIFSFSRNSLLVQMHLEIWLAISLELFYLEYSTFFFQDAEYGIGSTNVSLKPFVVLNIKIEKTL